MGETSLLGDLMVRVLADMGEYTKSLDDAQKQALYFGKVFSDSTESVSEAFRRLNGEAAVWGNSTEIIAQKQAVLKKEITSLIAQGVDPLSPRIEKLQNQYYKLGDESEALAKKQSTLKSQIKDIDNMLGGLGQKFIKLLTNPLVLATTAVIAAGKAFVDTTKALVDYGSEINDISERTGISTDAIQEYKFVAEQTGSSIETITNSVKLMTRGLDTNAEAFQKLGVQTRDAAGNYRSASEIFDETIAALGGITNETEQTKLALEIFGRDAQNLVPILKLGAGGLEEMKQKANDLGLVMSDKAIKAADEFGDSTDALAQSWKVFTMSLAKDALPVLQTTLDAFTDTIEKINAAKLAAENNKIIKSYLEGKASVIEYHDALKSMIELNQEAANDDRNNASTKTAALREIQYAYQELDRIKRDYAKAKEPEEREAAQAAASRAAAEALAAEKERLDALRAARDAATKEYQDSIAKTRQLEAAGLRTTVQAQDEVTAATKKYAEALVPVVAASGNSLIGAQSLKQALADLRAQGVEPTTKSVEALTTAQQVAAAAAAKARDEEEQSAISAKNAVGVYAKEEAEILEARKATWIDFTSIVSSAVKSTFESIGQDLAANELSWQSLGTAAINSIGAIVSALGDELAAKAAKTLVEAIAASLNPLTMATAPGLYAASAKLGLGAAAAWTAGGALKAIKLANGGIASRPTPAIVGDNPRYAELVQPLSPEFYASLGDGILSALASRARGPGVTEASVAQARSVATGSSGGSGGVTLQVGTLVADDAGLRKLERTLRRFGLQEDVRVGG